MEKVSGKNGKVFGFDVKSDDMTGFLQVKGGTCSREFKIANYSQLGNDFILFHYYMNTQP